MFCETAEKALLFNFQLLKARFQSQSKVLAKLFVKLKTFSRTMASHETGESKP